MRINSYPSYGSILADTLRMLRHVVAEGTLELHSRMLSSIRLVLVWAGLLGAANLLAADATPTRVAMASTAHEASGQSPSADTKEASPPPATRETLVSDLALAALNAAKSKSTPPFTALPVAVKTTQSELLPTDGKPGDVRFVVATTNLAESKSWLVPGLPLPPFWQWNRFVTQRRYSAHCSIDFMDAEGKWWHNELRGFNHHEPRYRVGQGEFVASGLTVYGIFILPGRTDLEDQHMLLDVKVDVDYHQLIEVAHEYARKDKRPGDPGTQGDGSKNVGLGGPCFKPSQCSNTYAHWALKHSGQDMPQPPGTLGWDTTPSFPYSTESEP